MSYFKSSKIDSLDTKRLHIVCFGYGAQAEKVSKYKNGIVCQSKNPKDIMECANKLLSQIKENNLSSYHTSA